MRTLYHRFYLSSYNIYYEPNAKNKFLKAIFLASKLGLDFEN